MNFTEAVKSCLGKYTTFSGRAARSEFWFFWLFSMIVAVVAMIIDSVLGTTFTMTDPTTGAPVDVGYGYIYLIAMLALFLPSLAVGIRRLHDTNRSGWWYLIVFLPLIGVILLIVWFCSKGTEGENNYGHDPLGGGTAAAFA